MDTEGFREEAEVGLGPARGIRGHPRQRHSLSKGGQRLFKSKGCKPPKEERAWQLPVLDSG